MFFGRHYKAIDEKGRVKIPSLFKKALDRKDEETLVLTNFANTIRVYPLNEWDMLRARSKDLHTNARNKLASDRFFFSSVIMVNVDKQGRFLIPNALRTETGLVEQIVILGLDYRFEIWDLDKWDAYQETIDKEEIVEDLVDEGY